MTENEIIKLIEEAFANVKLGNGIGSMQAQQKNYLIWFAILLAAGSFLRIHF